MTNKYKILVCGGRKFSDDELLNKTLDEHCRNRNISDIVIIHGGASGADTLADVWATSNGCEIRKYLADWDEWGKAAGPMRNSKMLTENPNIVFAFPGGAGTADMIKKSQAAGIPVIKVMHSYPIDEFFNVIENGSDEEEEQIHLAALSDIDNPPLDCIYRKKPVSVVAVEWKGDNENEIKAFASAGDRGVDFNSNGTLAIHTLEGVMIAKLGDFIIRGVSGEIYPCKPDIFDKTYEKSFPDV
jgi:hypothetical protein